MYLAPVLMIVALYLVVGMIGVMTATIGNISATLTLVVLIFGGQVSSAYLIVAQRHYVCRQTQLGEKLRLMSTLSTGSFLALTLTNTMIAIFTLRLGAPIREIRLRAIW